MTDGHSQEVTEVTVDLLKHELQQSDKNLQMLSQNSSNPPPKYMHSIQDFGFPYRFLTRSRRKSVSPELDFKWLAEQGFANLHTGLVKRQKYNLSSPQVRDLFKTRLAECSFKSGSTEIWFDVTLNQFAVKYEGAVYYICKWETCWIGLHERNQFCNKHSEGDSMM